MHPGHSVSHKCHYGFHRKPPIEFMTIKKAPLWLPTDFSYAFELSAFLACGGRFFQ